MILGIRYTRRALCGQLGWPAEAAGLGAPHPICGRGLYKDVHSRRLSFFFFFFGGAEDLCKLSHTVIILTKVENDGWDHLYTFFHLLDSMNLIGTCLIGSRMILLIPVLLPLRNSQSYSCWHIFNFFPRIWKQHALPTSDTFAIYKPISVISPLISLCVLKCELSSYLKFKCCPGLPSNMWNFEDESQSVNIFTFGVCCKRHQK